MSVTIVQQIQKLRGSSQPNLMLGDDDNLYVVKCRNNPQHTRVLANEMLMSLLIRCVGMPAPEPTVLRITDPTLLECCSRPTLRGSPSKYPVSELHFGSRFVGGLMPGLVTDYLPSTLLNRVANLHDFPGMLVLDKWCCNTDARQAVFSKKLGEKIYRVTFIDHGNGFGAGTWKFEDAPLRGFFGNLDVYKDVSGWDAFEPVLSRVLSIDPQSAWRVSQKIPSEWYEQDAAALEKVIDDLLVRRTKLHELIAMFRDSHRQPFPSWAKKTSLALSIKPRPSISVIDRVPCSV